MANGNDARAERLLKEAIKEMVLEERVNRRLGGVILEDDDILDLYEGHWDRIKHKLAAAGLAIACTATGCAPVVQATGQPVDPAELVDYGIDSDELPPGETDVDFDDTGSRSSKRQPAEDPPPTALGGSVKRNRPGDLPGSSLR